MQIIKVSAPGKIHLSGEHSVVYGQPALLSAIDKRLIVNLQPRKDKVINLKTENSNKDLLIFGIREVYRMLNKKIKFGFNLEVNSQIPAGSGLGSSAALSAALTAAILRLEKIDFNKNLINKIAFKIEKKQHGNPSGGDNTIAVFGGFLKFQKIKDKFLFSQLKPSKDNLPRFLLVDSGRPAESTGEMVALVNSKLKLKTKNLLKSIGKITKEFIISLEKENFRHLKNLINENERLLEELGVAGARAKKLIQLIKQAGGAAKICGAGGIKQGSGMLLAYCPELNQLTKTLKTKKINFFSIKLGQKGVRIEKS